MAVADKQGIECSDRVMIRKEVSEQRRSRYRVDSAFLREEAVSCLRLDCVQINTLNIGRKYAI